MSSQPHDKKKKDPGLRIWTPPRHSEKAPLQHTGEPRDERRGVQPLKVYDWPIPPPGVDRPGFPHPGNLGSATFSRDIEPGLQKSGRTEPSREDARSVRIQV